MAKTIRADDMEDLAAGAAILGTGGGGDPYIGGLLASSSMRKHDGVTLVEPDAVNDDAPIIPVGMMGAPTILIERIPNSDEALGVLRDLETTLGKRATAVMSLEAGGINSTIPFVVAARAGIPVVDADGMGRAFPELQMESFAIYGISGSPLAMRDKRGNSRIIRAKDNATLERLARRTTIRLGGSSHIAEYCMTGAEMKKTSIRNSLSLALELGRALREASKRKESPFEAISGVTERSNYGRGVVLFGRKIVDVDRRNVAGFASGKVTIEGLDEHVGETMNVLFQNENLLASVSNRVVATVPDLIPILDRESGAAITTEGLRYGQRVVVMGIPVPEIMRTAEALMTAYNKERDL